jgi:exonuclease III
MEQEEIDALLIQESNTNIKHPSTKEKIKEVMHWHLGVKYITSQTHFLTETEYKPGGTAIWINPLLSRHICDKIQDPLGWWAGAKLRMITGKIVIISIYQPPITESLKGSISILAQQKRWILEQQQSNANKDQVSEITDLIVRKQFREDLNKVIEEQQKLGFQIIVGGDFNKHHNTNNILTNPQEKYYLWNALEKYNLWNALEKYNLHHQDTYKHSHHILDKILCTRDLYHQIVKAKLMGYQTSVTTDHQPLLVHYKIQKQPDNHSNSMERKLISSNITTVTKYLQYKNNRMCSERLFKRIQAFSHWEGTEDKANIINSRIIQIILDAETRLRTYLDTGWNTQLPKLKQELKAANQQIKSILKDPYHSTTQSKTAIQQKKYIIRQFKLQQNQGYKIRHAEMQIKIEELETDKEKNKKLITHLKQMLYLKRKNLTFRKIKYQTPTVLQIQQPDSTINKITNIEDIAEKVSQYNMTHYA